MTDKEKPEQIAMTHGVTLRPHGLAFDETVGLDGAGPSFDAAAAGGVKDQGIHGTGELCARCGRVLTEDSWVRRTVAGEWIHDTCPEDTAGEA